MRVTAAMIAEHGVDLAYAVYDALNETRWGGVLPKVPIVPRDDPPGPLVRGAWVPEISQLWLYPGAPGRHILHEQIHIAQTVFELDERGHGADFRWLAAQVGYELTAADWEAGRAELWHDAGHETTPGDVVPDAAGVGW